MQHETWVEKTTFLRMLLFGKVVRIALCARRNYYDGVPIFIAVAGARIVMYSIAESIELLIV